jgi:hypothetical protein
MTLDEFQRRLQGELGENLLSLILFGPAALPDGVNERRELNLLVVTDSLDLTVLERIAPAVQRWVQGGNPQPMILSRERLVRSADAFPVELLDMKEAHEVLHGENVIRPLEIRGHHFHQQVEHLLKNLLLELRNQFILNQEDGDSLRDALIANRARLHLYFRAALRIFVPQTHSTDRANVQALSVHAAFSPEWIASVEELTVELPIPYSEIKMVYDHCLKAIEKTVDAVDRNQKRLAQKDFDPAS